MRKLTLDDLKPHIWDGRYRILPHAARHAISEGFTEKDIVHTLETGRELAIYPEDERVLILGYIRVSAEIAVPLHVVVELERGRLNVITAFIPQHPYRVISRQRLAIILGHERETPRERTVVPGPRRGVRGKPGRPWKARGA
ncbi:MAG TPA: DUF4258 domain-containing protein [Deinococcales bacterium]|nr:DUF4258 domain-containing protein [Deinococcales bacterium]